MLLANPSFWAARWRLQVGRECRREQHLSMHDLQHLRGRCRVQNRGVSAAYAKRLSWLQAEMKQAAAQSSSSGNGEGGGSGCSLQPPSHHLSSSENESGAWMVNFCIHWHRAHYSSRSQFCSEEIWNGKCFSTYTQILVESMWFVSSLAGCGS